ncbi:hypothetical protein [Flavisolibacter nicotianae]|nr:hypothetical protein [Flavisolibacter nicotianae]
MLIARENAGHGKCNFNVLQYVITGMAGMDIGQVSDPKISHENALRQQG